MRDAKEVARDFVIARYGADQVWLHAPPSDAEVTIIKADRREARAEFAEEIIARLTLVHFVADGSGVRYGLGTKAQVENALTDEEIRQMAKQAAQSTDAEEK